MGAICGWIARKRPQLLRTGCDAMIAALKPRSGDVPLAINCDTGALRQAGGQMASIELGGRTLMLVMEGAILNAPEIQAALEQGLPSPEGDADAVLVLKTYIQYGDSFASKLLGFYALALYDSRDEILYLSRDALGAQPLFYAPTGDGMIFASEIKGLLAAPGMHAKLTPEGLGMLWALGPARSPHSAIFDGIQTLPPGRLCKYQINAPIRLTRTFQIISQPHTDNLEETGAHILGLLQDMVTRMPVDAAFLSGGLDSSVICALRAAEAPLHTYSVEYADHAFKSNAYQPESDSAYVRIMVEALGCEHRNIVLEQEALVDALEEAMLARDLPGMADVDTSLLCFCKAVKALGVSEVYSGECADELLGGYPWFHRADLLALDTFPWSPDITARKRLLSAHAQSLCNIEEIATETYMALAAEAPNGSDRETPQDAHRRKLMYLCRETFMQVLLERGDRMSSRTGISIKMPFCDPRLAQYAANTPWSILSAQDREKGALRVGAQPLLPHDVVWRKKSPFPKTYSTLYSKLIGKKIIALLDDPSAPILPLIDIDTVRALALEPTSTPFPFFGQLMQGPQVLGMLWQTNAWLKHYRIDLPL